MRLDDDATSDLVSTWGAYEVNGEILTTLLEAGAAVNSKNEDGETALMVAAENGRLQNVRALRHLAGADINLVNAKGEERLDGGHGK